MSARFAILMLTSLLAFAATAQEARRAGTDSTARLQQQVQQLAGERTALQAENAKLKEQVARLEKDAKALATDKDSLSRRVGAAESKVSRAEAGQQSVSTRLEGTEARLNEVVDKYKELAGQLRKLEGERSELARQVAQDGQGLKICAQRNVQLAGIANEALDRYKNKGCFGALAQAEPFTGLKRVEVENAVEDYRQQVESLKLPAAAPSTGPEDDIKQ
jgi:chromosome segregation ATPase